jgi:hypothetical protein
MMNGLLRRLGYHIQRERIWESLSHIDPVQRVFQHIMIRHHTYSVPGPNAFWHHDGQHSLSACTVQKLHLINEHGAGLIWWKIVIHGFIDGYSHLITALHASNNNRSQTVLDLFLLVIEHHGIPSRMRGDHGIKNVLVAAWMVENRGPCTYIWGRLGEHY